MQLKKIFLTIFLAFSPLAFADHGRTHVYGINVLTPSMATMCVVGSQEAYDRINASVLPNTHAYYVLMHYHPADPPQLQHHYYWVHQMIGSCGGLFAYVGNDATQIQLQETFGIVTEALKMGKSPVLVGMPLTHPQFNQWKSHLKAHNVNIFTDIGTMMSAVEYYLLGGAGTAREPLIKYWDIP